MTAELKRGLGAGLDTRSSLRVCVCVCGGGGGGVRARYEKRGAPDRIAASFGLIQNVR